MHILNQYFFFSIQFFVEFQEVTKMSEVSPEVEKLRKNTINLLSAVLTAKAKVGIPLHLLAYEYEETVFEKLKFREMGYGTIEQFITDQSGIFTLNRGSDGHIHVKALPTEENKHIHRLVSGQKKKTKSKKKKVVISVKRFAGPRGSRTPAFNLRGGYRGGGRGGGGRGGGRPPSLFCINNRSLPPSSSRTFFSKSPSTVKPTNSFNNKKPVNSSLPPRFQRTLNNNNYNNNNNNNRRSQPKPSTVFQSRPTPSPALRNSQPSASSPISTTPVNGK